MTEFTPKTIRTPLRPRKAPCAACKGAHTTWWKTTPPPSCEAPTKGPLTHAELYRILAGLREDPGGRP